MKVRNCFVSNSSSSSFVIKKEALSLILIDAIINHAYWGERFGIPHSHSDQWSITETDDTIEGCTSLDNFDMETFLEKIGIKEEDIKWIY